MKCPVDEAELRMTERQGIEVDYCPQCRGVWLDRGELDKIIERSALDAPVSARRHEDDRGRPPHRDDFRDDRRPDYKKRKRESFLSDLFDF